MKMFDIGDKVEIKELGITGYVCDTTFAEEGHYIIDCYNENSSDDPAEYLKDVEIKEIELAD